MKKIILILIILLILLAMVIFVNSVKIPAPSKYNQHAISINNFL